MSYAPAPQKGMRYRFRPPRKKEG